jgi:glycosyltransferase involved in cell wall biosynthesis
MISVVVPVLNRAELLPDQLDALQAQDYEGDWEILVADNGSTDDTAAIAERLLHRHPRGRVVPAFGPLCASYARNAGAARAQGDFLAFTDADDVASPRWLSELARAAPDGDIVAGGVDLEALNDELARSWHPISPRDRAMRGFRFLSFASGLNIGIWTDVFRRLGGFDEGTRIGEDIELSWRAQLASHRLRLAPEAVVHQRLRSEIGAQARQHLEYGAAGPSLYRRFRRSGARRPPARDTLRTWGWLALTWPAIPWSRRVRGRWSVEGGVSFGRIAGSLRNRVLFL